MLQNLLLPRDQDLTDGSKFLWWLRVANLAQHQAEVVSVGIQKAGLLAVNACSAVVAFTRLDLSVVQVQLTASRAAPRHTASYGGMVALAIVVATEHAIRAK